jgi:CRP/FNR family transcriptional regulator, cyclic AMP receptor protein
MRRMDLPPVEGSLLSFVGPAEREHLIAIGVRRRFAEGNPLLRQGDPSDHVLLLLSGWVRVYATDADGQEMMIALRGPGDLIGELAALHGWHRTANVAALTQVDVVQLLRQQFVECVHTNPAIAVGLVKQMSARLREVQTILAEINSLDVNRRVAKYVLHLAARHGKPGPDGITLGMPLSQQDIAAHVGASLRSVARTLADLRRLGIIGTDRRRIVVRRPAALRSYIGGMPDGTQ